MARKRALLITLAVIWSAATPLLLWRLRPFPSVPPALSSAAVATPSPACARRGPVVLTAASAPELQAIADAFRRRNGPGWHTKDTLPRGVGAYVDPISRAVRASDTMTEAPVARLSAAAARARATDFVRRNADLLGIWPDEIDQLAIAVFPEPGGSWSTAFTLTHPPRGYEAFPSVRRTISVGIDTSADGVRQSLRAGPLLPRFELCTIPLLRPEDPAVRRDIVGREFFLVGADGGPDSLGRATEADIAGAPELIIDVVTTSKAITLTLAYRLIVMRSALALHLVVDADTGRFLREQPCWVTETCATATPSAAR